MATESTATPVTPSEAAPIINGEGAGVPAGTEGRPQRERRKHTPPEELYDLTKPIPKESKPEQVAHDTQIEAITSSIDALKDLKTALQTKLESALSSNRSSISSTEREAMKELRKQKANLINQKKALQTTLGRIKKTTDGLMNDRKAARTSVRYSSVDQIEKEITRLKNRQETVSMSLGEEKQLIKEMDALQKSKGLVASFKQTDASIDDSKLQRKDIGAQIKAKDEEIDAVQAQIAEKQKVLDEMRSSQDEQRKGVDEMKKEREVFKTQIGEKLNERKEVRTAFNAQKDKWFDYQRAIKAQKKLKWEEEKRAREEEDNKMRAEWEAEEAKKVPYEAEQLQCTYLSDYLTRTYVTTEKKTAETKSKDFVALKDDPFAGFKPRQKPSEEETYLQVGKERKKPRVRASKKNAAPVFKLSVEIFEQFSVLGLSPPTSIEGVPQAIEALNEKKEWYSKQARGSVPTASEIRKASAEAKKQAGAKKSTKKNGKIDISGDDFAPLSAGSSAAGVNSSWGQKTVEEPVVVEEEPAPDAAAETVEASA